MSIDVREAGANDVDSLQGLLESHQLDEYRGYPYLNHEKLVSYRRSRLEALLQHNQNVLLIAEQNGAPVGMVTIEQQEWGSEHFGVEMRKMDHLVYDSTGIRSDAIRDALFDAVDQYTKTNEVQHLSLRVDTQAVDLVHYLQRNGYLLVDTILKYVINCRKIKQYDLKPVFTIRAARPEDIEDAVGIAGEVFSIDRFHSDPGFEKEKADTFYSSWTRKAWQGEMADVILVAERRGDVVGFLGYRQDTALEQATGIKLVGSGLGAVSRKSTGAYPLLLSTAVYNERSNDIIDLETQINNYAVTRVYQRLGFYLVNTRYTFHKWL